MANAEQSHHDEQFAKFCAEAAEKSLTAGAIVYVMRRPNGKLVTFAGNPHLFSGTKVAAFARGHRIDA